MTEQPEELNVCQDCHERRGRPPIIDYPTNPFIMCHDCNADTDLLAIHNPHQENRPMTEQPATITQDNLTEFLIGYRDAAHWTGQAWNMSDETGYDDSDFINHAKPNETADDLPATVAADIMAEALDTFGTLAAHNNGHTLATYAAHRHQQSTEADGWNLTGHDARLSIDHNGTGLWDRGIAEGDTLHDQLTQHYARTLTLDTTTDTYYFE